MIEFVRIFQEVIRLNFGCWIFLKSDGKWKWKKESHRVIVDTPYLLYNGTQLTRRSCTSALTWLEEYRVNHNCTTRADQSTAWLQEDVPSFDYGGFVVGDEQKSATLYGKSAGTIAGRPFFDEIFRQLDCEVEWLLPEGSSFEPIAKVAIVRGPVRKILLGERIALNVLARCSGIATQSRRLLHKVRQAGYKGIIAGHLKEMIQTLLNVASLQKVSKSV